jgi:hypothetical protein
LREGRNAVTLDLRKAFRHVAALLAFGLAGAGVGGIATQPHHRPEGAKSPDEIKAVATYTKQLSSITQRQARIFDSSTDEEAANRLANDKLRFRTDVLLDQQLNEQDVAGLAAAFNKLSDQDNIKFASLDKDPASANQRNQCLADITADERNETAARVDDCMLVYARRERQQDSREQKEAALLGGLFGLGLAGSYMLGRRQRVKPA